MSSRSDVDGDGYNDLGSSPFDEAQNYGIGGGWYQSPTPTPTPHPAPYGYTVGVGNNPPPGRDDYSANASYNASAEYNDYGFLTHPTETSYGFLSDTTQTDIPSSGYGFLSGTTDTDVSSQAPSGYTGPSIGWASEHQSVYGSGKS